MADYKLQTGVAATQLITTGLNSLANGSRVVSSAIDNSTNLNMFMDLELAVKYGTAPSAGVIAAEVYLIGSFDNTNYAAGDTSNTPQASNLVATFESRIPSTSVLEYLHVYAIPIPIGNFKLLLVNKSGQSYGSSGNILSYRTYKFQIS